MINTTKKYTYFFLLFSLTIASCKTTKQLSAISNPCDSLYFDITDGTINGVKPTLSQADIKEWFPCYTSALADGAASGCGGGVFFDKYDFYYYTFIEDYVEVRGGFKGRTTHDLMGKSKEEVRSLLGVPVETKFNNTDLDFFTMDYGCLRVQYKDNKVVILAAHYKDCDSIELCY